jgi:hypothetical protein
MFIFLGSMNGEANQRAGARAHGEWCCLAGRVRTAKYADGCVRRTTYAGTMVHYATSCINS